MYFYNITISTCYLIITVCYKLFALKILILVHIIHIVYLRSILWILKIQLQKLFEFV